MREKIEARIQDRKRKINAMKNGAARFYGMKVPGNVTTIQSEINFLESLLADLNPKSHNLPGKVATKVTRSNKQIIAELREYIRELETKLSKYDKHIQNRFQF